MIEFWSVVGWEVCLEAGGREEQESADDGEQRPRAGLAVTDAEVPAERGDGGAEVVDRVGQRGAGVGRA
jgi:hypothetical protein